MSGQISLTVYDMMGSEVTQLVNSRMEEGYDASAKGERLHKMQQASKHQRIQPFGIELAKLNLPNEL